MVGICGTNSFINNGIASITPVNISLLAFTISLILVVNTSTIDLIIFGICGTNLVINCGIAVIMPCSSFKAPLINAGTPFTKAVTNCGIKSTIAFTISGSISPTPSSIDPAICIPAVISCGNSPVNAVISCGINSTTMSIMSGNISVMPLITLCTAFISTGKRSLISGGISFNISGKVSFISPSTSLPSPSITVFIRGIRFLATVTTLSTKSEIKPLKLALSSAIPVSRFCQAALAIPIEPLIVVAASFAVVPVIPISVCTTCIASYTSFKLLMSYLTPLSFSASSKSLCISSLVPP